MKKDKGKNIDPESMGQPEAAAEEAAGEVTQEQLNEEIAELQGRLQRLGADYQNYQKRSERQIQQAVQWAREEVVRSLLGVLDNFDVAMERGREAQDVEALLEGFRIVRDHLGTALASQGLRPIAVEPGLGFDPALHEAMLHEPTAEFPENTVVRELSRGYQMGERTLRPAKVSVAKAVAPEVESPRADQAQQE
jgi:molecular chaperone GrpE